MKRSGVEWLGEVPAHWEVVALKRHCLLLKDGTHQPPARVGEGVRLLSVRNIQNNQFQFRDDDSLIAEADFNELCRSFVPKPNDVLLAIVGATLGKAALVPVDLGPFHIQRSLAIFRTASQLRPQWLNFVFQSSGFQRLLWEYAGYSAQPGIYLETLANFHIPLPNPSEQSEIIALVKIETGKLDALLGAAAEAISLLQERRSALISAAVTGKIDVRGLVPVEAEAA
jgi:type I restriction enzyme S subunit